MIMVNNASKVYNIKKKEKDQSFIKNLLKPKATESFYALKDLNLSIKQNEKFGYIGNNRAGKSTTVKLLTGIIEPTQGDVRINQMNPYKERRKYVNHIGTVFGQRNQLFWDLMVKESFHFNKAMYKIMEHDFKSKMDFFNKYIDLDELLHKPVMKLSLGQKMKANISLSLLHSPKLLFLAEPTIGLDIFTKEALRNMLNDLNKQEETTILFTSHDMDDIDQICDRIILLDRGRKIIDCSIENFKKKYGVYKKLKLQTDNINKVKHALESNYSLDAFQIDAKEDFLTILVDEGKINASELIKELFHLNITIDKFEVQKSTLEDIIKNFYKKGD